MKVIGLFYTLIYIIIYFDLYNKTQCIDIVKLKLIFKCMVILIDILLLQSRLMNSIEKY